VWTTGTKNRRRREDVVVDLEKIERIKMITQKKKRYAAVGVTQKIIA
jgi:hypothetical protein